MLELGKPIHTFDAAAVRGGRIIVRAGAAGRAARDARPRRPRARPRDAAHRRSGRAARHRRRHGRRRRPRSSDATTDVVVESAIFDPVSIRRTAFRYALRSEASLRFEKGQESRLARLGADRTARLVAEWAGGDRRAGRRRLRIPTEPAPARVAFRPARVDRLLGATIPAEEQRALLARVGIEATPAPAGTRVPGRRRDDGRSTWSPVRTPSSRRPCRRGAATSPSRPTSPRRSSACAATTRCHRSSRTRRCPSTGTTRSSCATPSARRSSGPA